MGIDKQVRIVGLALAACTALVVHLPACGGEEPPPLVPSPMPAPPPPLPAPPPPIADAPAPRPVMADAQKKFLADLEAGLAARDAKKVAALYSTGAVLVSAGKEGVHEAVGRAEIEKGRERGFAVMGKAFPDIKWVNTRALQKGDVMVVEWVANGTDTGGFLEDKPTNKKVGWRGASIYWFDDDGLVKRELNVLDPMTILGQLGRGDSKARVRPAAATPTAPTQWVTAKDTPEEAVNLETVKAFYGLFEKKDDKAIVAAMTDDVVHSDLAQPDDAKGKDGAKKEVGVWLKAFPDLKMSATHAWAFGDVVVAAVETTGTFKGPLGALKPSGKTATTHGVDVIDMKGGKIARVTSYTNARDFLIQYDLMPKPTAPSATPATPTK
ncbi:MAG: hypothetical protein JWO86_3267 [Myxococcaceae bacterium]|nr:hypothetical protein [Myxococcaceae bacterium]